MFSDINSHSAQRITEVRENLDFLSPLLPAPPIATPRHLNTSKGLLFVQLYGVIEFTVSATISKALNLINAENIRVRDLNPLIWSMVFDSELEALYQVRRKKWDKRKDLFDKIANNHMGYISTDIMPTDGGNCDVGQLQSIWNTFNITEPIFNDVAFRGRLQDIVSNRINIAHGISSAAEVGARVTPSDLYKRIQDVSGFCSYFISTFEDYIVQKKFKTTP